MSFWRDLQRKRTHVPIRFGRSLLTVRPLRAGTSSASPQGVERPVNRCTQVLHRNARTPLHDRGKIVDMIAPVGVLISSRDACSTCPQRSTPTMWRCCGGGDVGRLALLFGDARVDGAVELVLLQLALDVGL